jgi:hypothetical protein
MSNSNRRFLCLENTAGFKAGSIYIDQLPGIIRGEGGWFIYTRDVKEDRDLRFKEVSFNLYYNQIEDANNATKCS